MQTIDGMRFVGIWITNRKTVKVVASADEEPVIVVVTRRGLVMLRPVDLMLSAYHWSEIRSFGCTPMPVTETYDIFCWLHRSTSYTLHTAMADELEHECNSIINQALGGTFASRAVPKYYPPSPYNPSKDADAGTSFAAISNSSAAKPEKWDDQRTERRERGISFFSSLFW